jgi:hypothetical protein
LLLFIKQCKDFVFLRDIFMQYLEKLHKVLVIKIIHLPLVFISIKKKTDKNRKISLIVLKLIYIHNINTYSIMSEIYIFSFCFWWLSLSTTAIAISEGFSLR